MPSISPRAETANRSGLHAVSAWSGWLRDPYLAIWPATVLLFLVSPLIAPGSVGIGALQGTLPFAAILAITGIGQTLVIQQRGLDLSVPGIVSLAAVIVVVVPDRAGHGLLGAILISLVASAAAGLVSGIAVTRFGITPLIATLGVNALLLGTILQITHGGAGSTATDKLAHFAVGRVFGVPHLVVIAVIAIVVVALIVRTTKFGRTFVAVGTSVAAANAAGMKVRAYVVAAYSIAGLCYGVAGILIAGYLRTPGNSVGNSYLLPSIAAVVLGGTSLAGGGGSVVATGVGALFLSQLQQVVFGAGAATSVQLIIQSSVIGVGMAIRTIPWRQWFGRRSTQPLDRGAPRARDTQQSTTVPG